MLKVVIIMLALMIVFGGIVAAQDAQPTAETPQQREIYGVLQLGDRIFEPSIWLAGGQEQYDRTTANWYAQDVSGVALAEYLHFDEGFDGQMLTEFFNNDWFASAFADYDSWSQTNACTNGTTTLYEFSLLLDGVNFQVRYWIDALPPSRVLTFEIVLPNDQAALLDQYASRYKPEFFACP
jgi:hypothetical protein